MQENFTSPIDRRADYYRQRAREEVDPSQSEVLTGKLPPAQPLLTIPNALTIFRIALVPFLVVAYLHSSPLAPLLAASTFGLAAITDWADGYLARRVKLCLRLISHLNALRAALLTPVSRCLIASCLLSCSKSKPAHSGPVQLRIASAFGAFLDPVADKLMVATALMLLAVRPPPGLSQEQVLMPVLVSIMREIAMSSLREWAAKSSSQASKVCLATDFWCLSNCVIDMRSEQQLPATVLLYWFPPIGNQTT